MREFCSPPERFRGQFGKYRSVMQFDDGSKVDRPEDWPRRRAEIRRYWLSAIGPWPGLIESPRARTLAEEHVENFTRRKLELQVAAKRSVVVYLLVPDGDGPFPAVLVTWYNAKDSAGLTEKARGTVDFGLQLARRGFVTLCLGSVGSADVRKYEGAGDMQPLSYMAFAAANCCNALANLPEVDAGRIGVTGHSFGGKWAMFASCLYEKFACAVWVDPGIVWNEKDPNANYWDPWYLGFDPARKQQRPPGAVGPGNPRTGAYRKLVEAGHDLHELHALMVPRPFLVSGGAQDRPEHWVALNHAVALNKFLGHENRVAMTMRNGHTPTPESNAQLAAFLEHHLKAID